MYFRSEFTRLHSCMSRQKECLVHFSESSENQLGNPSFQHMTLFCLRIALNNIAQPDHTTVNKEGSTKRLLLGLFPCTGFLVATHYISCPAPLNYRALLSLVFISSQSHSSGHVRKEAAGRYFNFKDYFSII